MFWATLTTTRPRCASCARARIASWPPNTDPTRTRTPGSGGGQARLFHDLRSRAIENFNGQFKSIFEGQGQVPTKGQQLNTARFALGAVLVYQLALLYQYEHSQELGVGLKAFLKAA